MNQKYIFLSLLAGLVYITSCTKEAQPIFITGTWEAYYYEKVECEDSISDIKIDFTLDSTYSINGKEVKFLSYSLDFDDSGNYTFMLSKNVDGKDTLETESGNYLSSGFNDINFCLSDCKDSLYNSGIFVRTSNQLDLTWQDTFDINCGFLFQARLK